MTNIDKIKQHFSSRTNTTKTFSSWKSVLDALYKLDPKDGNYYMLTTNKGSDEERRGRFYTHAEAIEVVMKEMRDRK